ncbi:MAG: EutN/CcmL family microcompartment protein [Limisphaerales bacterium]
MRLGRVIGRVTLSRTVAGLDGARWLVVNPFNRARFPQGTSCPPGLTPEPSLVVYDNLGGGVGDVIGFVEGREAAQPFPVSPPIDAINAALVDHVFHRPH